MDKTNDTEALTYVLDEPNLGALKTAYDKTISDLGWYFESCRDSFDIRRNIWAGKSKDLRKNGADAFPWKGASDNEVPLVDERINTYVALFMSALNRANIRAYPVEMGDMGRARVVSAFLKWMVSSYIPQFKRQMELGANYLLERGIFVSYVGWQKEDHTYLQSLSLEQIGQVSPDLVKMVLDGGADEALVELFTQQFNGVTPKRAKKALKQLRATGKAELPVVRRSVDAPLVMTCAPDSDVFFPAYTTDYQQSPYCFMRCLMTAQELRNKVNTEGWDEDNVEFILSKGPDAAANDDITAANTRVTRSESNDTTDLYGIIYCYQRLIDREDNAEGIYCTVFHPSWTEIEGESGHLKFELLNGYDDYPFVVTKLGEDNKRLYELATIPEQLRGLQWSVKVERDSRVDRNSMATVPPIMHPVGNPPAEWGPKAFVPYRRAGEFMFGPVPQYNPGSVEIENTQIEQADRAMGLDMENPLSASRQQYFVDKFLSHVRDVLRLAYKCYQRFGPDEVFFRVTGAPDPQRFNKGNPDEDFDVVLNFDVLNNDPENLEKQLQQFVSLVQLDRNGRINMDRLLEAMAGSINPLMADAVLQPAEEASQQVVKQVTDDLTKIASSIEVPARPNGAQIALQVIQQYASQPDVQEKLSRDKAFNDRLTKYQGQYAFMVQQAQNAQIGRIGTMPASVGGMQTQSMPS